MYRRLPTEETPPAPYKLAGSAEIMHIIPDTIWEADLAYWQSRIATDRDPDQAQLLIKNAQVLESGGREQYKNRDYLLEQGRQTFPPIVASIKSDYQFFHSTIAFSQYVQGDERLRGARPESHPLDNDMLIDADTLPLPPAIRVHIRNEVLSTYLPELGKPENNVWFEGEVIYLQSYYPAIPSPTMREAYRARHRRKLNPNGWTTIHPHLKMDFIENPPPAPPRH